MALIDLDNFIESLMWMWNSPETAILFNDLKLALDKQGLVYKNGKITKTQRRVSAETKENGYGESEDEKVINEIINTVTGYHPTHSSKEIQKMIDWLEQQKSK